MCSALLLVGLHCIVGWYALILGRARNCICFFIVLIHWYGFLSRFSFDIESNADIQTGSISFLSLVSIFNIYLLDFLCYFLGINSSNLSLIICSITLLIATWILFGQRLLGGKPAFESASIKLCKKSPFPHLVNPLPPVPVLFFRPSTPCPSILSLGDPQSLRACGSQPMGGRYFVGPAFRPLVNPQTMIPLKC